MRGDLNFGTGDYVSIPHKLPSEAQSASVNEVAEKVDTVADYNGRIHQTAKMPSRLETPINVHKYPTGSFDYVYSPICCPTARRAESYEA